MLSTMVNQSVVVSWTNTAHSKWIIKEHVVYCSRSDSAGCPFMRQTDYRGTDRL